MSVLKRHGPKGWVPATNGNIMHAGTMYHDELQNRDKPDQHPMEAITGLKAALENTQPKGDYATSSDIPKELPNPNAITFTGKVSAIYDGSAPVEVNIPVGGADYDIIQSGSPDPEPPASGKGFVIVEGENIPDPPTPGGDISLGLTGMAVGDKVEVASVDNKGMPTGWRRKGKFELISHIEIKEAGISKIVRDKDANGKPFRLEKIILRAESAPGSEPVVLYLQHTGGSYTRVENFGGPATTYAVISVDVSEGFNNTIAYTEASKEKYVPVGMSSTPFGFTPILSAAKNFSVLGSSAFSVGTVFDVWGVRV